MERLQQPKTATIMTEAQTQLRIHRLNEALRKNGRLSTEERWLVHQEKAYLLNSLSDYPTMEPYRVPESIENKITTWLQ